MENICENMQEQIPELITGTLATEKADTIRHHVGQCSACREYLRALEADDELLGNFAEAMQPRLARLENNVIDAFGREPSNKSIHSLLIWRTIMGSRITKLTAAAAIIVLAALSITFLEKSTPTAYALDQTVEANRTIRYLHFKMFNASRDDDAKESWIEFSENGDVKNVRVNFPKWHGGGPRMVWKEDKTQVWTKKKNTLEFFEDELYTAKVLKFARRYNPRGAVEHLYDMQAQGKVKIEIDEPSDKDEPIVVTATYLPNTYLLEGAMPEMREVLFVDQTSKLVKAIEVYELKDGEHKYLGVYEYQDYNKPFDTKIFSLEDEVPADVKRIDRMTSDIGLEQGNLTDDEIAVKVVREFLEALIAKDYATAGKLHGGMSPEEAKQRMKLKVLRIISIGEPVLHGRPAGLRVPCVIEIEKNGQVKEWHPKGPFVRRVIGRPDRWSIVGGF